MAVTSGDNAATAKTSHSSGKNLVDLADVAVDNCLPREDALVPVDGQLEPPAAGSTLAFVFTMALVAQLGAGLVETWSVARGFRLAQRAGRLAQPQHSRIRGLCQHAAAARGFRHSLLPAIPLAIGIDVDAIKVAAGPVEMCDQVRERVQEPLSRQGGEGVVRQVVRLAERLALHSAPVAVSVPVPAVSIAGDVKWCGRPHQYSRLVPHPVGRRGRGVPAHPLTHWSMTGTPLCWPSGGSARVKASPTWSCWSSVPASAVGWSSTVGCIEAPTVWLARRAGLSPAPASLRSGNQPSSWQRQAGRGASRGHAADAGAESVFAAGRAGDAEAQQSIDATADRLGLGDGRRGELTESGHGRPRRRRVLGRGRCMRTAANSPGRAPMCARTVLAESHIPRCLPRGEER